MRRLRLLIAIPAVAGLAIIGATGASAAAAPAHHAAHPRATTATSSGADPWYFENENGLYIDGITHNEPIYGNDAGPTDYIEYNESSPAPYWVYSANGLCWDTTGANDARISMESCPADDSDEWFNLTLENGDYGFLQTWSGNGGLCIQGDGNENVLYLAACNINHPRDLWEKVEVSDDPSSGTPAGLAGLVTGRLR
jgi:hypothetical protein